MSAEPGASLASISFGQHALHVSEIGRDTGREGVGHFLPGSLRGQRGQTSRRSGTRTR
jgi:hypothetical protein